LCYSKAHENGNSSFVKKHLKEQSLTNQRSESKEKPIKIAERSRLSNL